MKFFSISTIRSPASVLVLASTIVLGISGIAHAQYGNNTSGQGAAAGQGSGTEQGVTEYGILEEPMDQGFVDQKKRAERNRDPRSPSPDTHVDIPPIGKERPSPAHEQGGPIGPN